MPTISVFYGDESATFYLSNGELYEGKFPNRGKKMVKEQSRRTIKNVVNRAI